MVPKKWRVGSPIWTPERLKPFLGKKSAPNCSARGMKVRFHPDARAELKTARTRYEERSPLSLAALAHEILPGFHFNIFCRVGTTDVIVAIAHQKRTPGPHRNEGVVK